MKKILFTVITVLLGTFLNSTAQIPYPGNAPGKAVIKSQGEQIIMENNALVAVFLNVGEKIALKAFICKNTKGQIELKNAPLFQFTLSEDTVISSNDFILVKSPVISDIEGEPMAITYAGRLPGKKISADFTNKKLGLHVHWEVHLRDGSNYIRQVFAFNTEETVTIPQITLIRLPLDIGIKAAGVLDGIPLICNNMFFAIENPLSKVGLSNTDIIATLPKATPVTPLNPFTVSTVWGITPVNQLRRGFLYYVERERAAPYHQMSFYNSWGDIAWLDRKMHEKECLDRIKWFGDSLITKRNVQLKAFLFDDGWDDNRTLWKFHSGFPNGFINMKKLAKSIGSTIGVWISPFGGYGTAKKLRLEYGKKQNPPFETNENGFSLSGPVYYSRFKEVLVDFIKKYDISMLKFDGVGKVHSPHGAGVYLKDMEAYLNVTKELRDIKPDLYFCLTSGTWASPFFLKYGDCVWRGGGDYGYVGSGSKRQRWITYRDAEVYKNVIKRSPLYPLSALQNMGIFICDIGEFGNFGIDEKDISDDIWSALGTGTAVQGQYINPQRMNAYAWDCLAQALKWAKANENIMADMHWIGGDPAKGEIYGFAAWTPEKAVLTLRNPSSEVKKFEIEVANIFEIPNGFGTQYLFYDAKKDMHISKIQPVVKGSSFEIILQPFDVLVFDASPQKN